jgi:hypothetical protein
MKKIDRIILWVLGLGFPIVVGLMIWYSNLAPRTTAIDANASAVWGDYFGIFFMAWMVLAVVMLFRLLINSSLRETILSSVARIKERDEREVEISGHAAKFTFFANLALLVCLLFFSSITMSVIKYKDAYINDVGEPKHGRLSMGLSLKSHDKTAIKITNTDDVKELNYNELPLSKPGIIILLIVFQVGMYHLSARKKSRLV